jgi:hypothetical protein
MNVGSRHGIAIFALAFQEFAGFANESFVARPFLISMAGAPYGHAERVAEAIVTGQTSRHILRT